MGYVEEHDHEGEEGREDTDDDEEAHLGEVGQGANTDLGSTCC